MVLSMHQFRSSSTIFRIRIASALLLLGYPLVVVSLGVLVYALLHNDRELATQVPLLFAVAVVMLIFHWVIARRTHCPLCMTPVLAKNHCSKHRRARKMLGSYRLRVAVAVLVRGKFSCPYCNERSALKVRERRH